ncbi:hypothetical protein Btru_002568 [Bulinus truncatus]|nr:hypothetical protein Btru_002568 [Bulinus truncatus]
MASHLHTVAVLIALIAILVPEPGTTVITAEFKDNVCPKQQFNECTRRMYSKTQYAVVKSRMFGANFLCDTETDQGGWIVIQRRVNKDTIFEQYWDAYKYGFGEVCGDYWLGNEHIYEITHSGKFELMIDMKFKSKSYFARYQDFYINDELSNYTLHVSGFIGNTSDEFSYHNNMQFSTPDRDNDMAPRRDCARDLRAGWWYGHQSCHGANLNGYDDLGKHWQQAIHWKSITGDYATLDAVEMKVRERKR